MKVSEAPPAGWYPDPDGGSRLRWWEGTDWSDRYRSRPTVGVSGRAQLAADKSTSSLREVAGHVPQMFPNADPQALVRQVQAAARTEAQRAAQLFGAEARSVARDLTPLITKYTSRVTRVLKVLSVIAIVLLIAWVAFQIFAQQSMLDWIGDRIDNLSSTGAELRSVDGARRSW